MTRLAALTIAAGLVLLAVLLRLTPVRIEVWTSGGHDFRWPRHRYPTPEDFDAMSPAEFDAYVERIGFDARIRAALAEPREAGWTRSLYELADPLSVPWGEQ